MAQLDVLKIAESMRQRLVDFGVDNSFVKDPQVAELCRRIWSASATEGGLISDLWVEAAFPARASEFALRDLVEQDLFNRRLCAMLDRPDVVPKDRPLYTHQDEAIRQAQALFSVNYISRLTTITLPVGRVD
jgi:hypothetical protein